MRAYRLFAVDQHGRPCKLPTNQPHTRGQNRPDTQEDKPEEGQEGDRDDRGDSIQEDRQGCALPTRDHARKGIVNESGVTGLGNSPSLNNCGMAT
jgi:hypothetical protein